MPTPLELMVRKLRTRSSIGEEAAAVILGLPHVSRIYDPLTYLVREGQGDLDRCSFVVSGQAFRQKLTNDGAREIVSLHIPGDFLDLQQLFLRHADHSVQALTKLTTIDIDRRALRELAMTHPSIGQAMWVDALVEASIYREWLINIGRRDGVTRIAHLLCELAVRLKAIGLGDGRSCELVMTQEQLGDAVGMTSVHVNRMLKALTEAGVIERTGRSVSFGSWERISTVAEFSPAYLHLDLAENNAG